MITVAIIGIVAASASVVSNRVHAQGIAELQRAKAQLLLEHLAEHHATGSTPDPKVTTRLMEQLSGADVSETHTAGLVTVTVQWHSPFEPSAARSLTVFSGEGR